MIYYKNSAGKEIHFDEPPFLIDITELSGFELSYQTNAYTSRHGGRVNGFTSGVSSKNISVGVSASAKGIREALDRILEVTQYDVLSETPGRLYVGEYYVLCNLYGSSMDSMFDPEIEYVEKTYNLVLSYPFWCRELSMDYLPGGRVIEQADYLDYLYDYNYDYLFDDFAVANLENNHYAASDFQMVFYGPAVNPRVTIGGHLYHIQTILYDGDYLIIDSRTGTIERTRNSGIVENLFNYRDKESNIFQKIPPGINAIAHGHTFGFTIILFQERSELPWSIS